MKKRIIKTSLVATLSLCLVACGSDNQNHLQQGKASLEQQAFKTAVIQLKNAVKQAPEDADARFYLGLAYFNTGDAAGAEKEFERALDYGYSPNEVIPYLTKLYQSQGNKKGIYKLVAKSKGVKPKVLAELKLTQAKTYVDSGEHEKAQAILDELKAIPQSGEYGLLGQTYSFVIKNNIEAALSQLDVLLESYPKQLEAIRLKGKLLIANGEPQLAIDTIQQYVELNPQDYNTQMLLAKLYLDNQQAAQTLRLVEPLSQQYPQATEVLSLKANALIQESDFEGALKAAEQVISLNSEDIPARLMAGVSAYYVQDYTTADKHLSLIASVLPANHMGLRVLADSQLKLGESSSANNTLDLLSKTVFSGDIQNLTERDKEVLNKDAVLLSQLGHQLVQEGQIKKAKSLLEKLPDNLEQPESLVNIGVLKLSLNDISGIEDLELAADQLDQNPQQLNNVLAQAYLKTGQYEKAKKLAAEMAKIPGAEAQSNVLLAKVALLNGNKEDAATYLKNAQKQAPQNPDLLLANLMVESVETKAEANQRLTSIKQILSDFPAYTPAMIQHYAVSKQFEIPETMSVHIKEVINSKDKEIEFDPNQLKFVLANILMSEGQVSEATQTLEDIVQSLEIQEQQQSSSPYTNKVRNAVFKQLGQGYVKLAEYQKAFEHYKQWYEQSPSQPFAVIGYVRLLQAQNNYTQALDVSKQYLSTVTEMNTEVQVLHLQNLVWTNNLEEFDSLYTTLGDGTKALPYVKGLNGQRLLRAQKPEDALAELTTAYNAIPSPHFASLLTTSIRQTKGEQASMTFLKEHLQRHENDQLNALRYATLMTYKNNDEAIKYYKRVLQLNSNNAIASNNLAHVYMSLDDLDAALKYGENALRIAPNNPNILDTIGMIHLRMNNNERALELLSKAVAEAKPQASDEMFVNYIEALAKNAEFKLANRKLANRKINDTKQAARLEELKTEFKELVARS